MKNTCPPSARQAVVDSNRSITLMMDNDRNVEAVCKGVSSSPLLPMMFGASGLIVVVGPMRQSSDPESGVEGPRVLVLRGPLLSSTTKMATADKGPEPLAMWAGGKASAEGKGTVPPREFTSRSHKRNGTRPYCRPLGMIWPGRPPWRTDFSLRYPFLAAPATCQSACLALAGPPLPQRLGDRAQTHATQRCVVNTRGTGQQCREGQVNHHHRPYERVEPQRPYDVPGVHRRR